MPSEPKTEPKNFFPHEIVRESQKELIEDLDMCMKDKKVLVAHAPTGLGKTASALSVALKYAIAEDKTVFFLTNRHTQHQIAVNTLKMMRTKLGENILCIDLIGKRWMCNQEVAGLFGNEFNEFCKSVVEKGECEFYNKVHVKKELTVEAKKAISDLEHMGPLHNEEIISFAKDLKMCSYELSLALAKKAKVLIGDYYYMFNPFVQSTVLKKLGKEVEDIILIVDEGHNLPNRITDMLSSNLSSYTLKNAVVEAKRFSYGGIIIWLQELMRVLNELAEFEGNEKECLVDKGEFTREVTKFVDYDLLIEQLQIAAEEIRKKQQKSYLGGIGSFLESWKGEDEGYARILSIKPSKYGDVTTLSYSCLDPSIITKDIFSRIHSGIIMSGTLKPTFMYKDILGISKGVEKEYSSPFPLENKLSIIIPETSTKFTVRGEGMYQQIAQKCSQLCSLIPGNVALFFPSYDLRDRISLFIETTKKKFWEKSEMSKEEKEEFLSQFKAEKDKGGVLLGVTGANFAEGIDLPGDLLNGVVVIGLPLARPDLKTREIIKYYQQVYGKGWDYGYIYPAMNKCLQSAGRCIRSETDKGAIIYLDERFAWQNYFVCFPSEGLKVSKEYEKLVKEFFGKKE